MAKKFLSLIMLMLTLVLAMASCGGGDSDEGGEPSGNPQHTHAFEEWETVKDATCIAKGSKERYCSCGEKQTAEIPTKAHSFGEWQQVKAPTKTEKGSKERTCACGEKETEEIAKLSVVTTITAQQWKNDIFDLYNCKVVGSFKGREEGINFDYNVELELNGEFVKAQYFGACEHGETSIVLYEQDDDMFGDFTGLPLGDLGEQLDKLLGDLNYWSESAGNDAGYSKLTYSESEKSYSVYNDDGDLYTFWFEEGRFVKFSYVDAKIGKLSATVTLSDFDNVPSFVLPHSEILQEMKTAMNFVSASDRFYYYDENYDEQYVDTADLINHFKNLESATFDEYEKSVYVDTVEYEFSFDVNETKYRRANIEFEEGKLTSITFYTSSGIVDVYLEN